MWKSRMLFLFSMVSAILLTRLYDNKDIGFIAIYALLLLLLISLVSALLAPLLIRIEESSDNTKIYKNNALAYTVRIINYGIFFYPNLVFQCYSSEFVTYGLTAISLFPRQTLDNETIVYFPYRGEYKLGIESVSVTDFLGLFRITFAVNKPLSVAVFPKSSEDFSFFVQNNSQINTYKYNLYNENYADIADVRKYMPSDHFRKIHWKLSAKRNELMVKNYQTFEPGETLLVVDTKQTPVPDQLKAGFEDEIMSFVAAAVNHSSWSHQTSWLVYGTGDQDRTAIGYAEDLEKVYMILTKLAFDKERSQVPDICRTLEPVGGAYNISLFLSDLDSEMFQALNETISFEDVLQIYFFYSTKQPPSETVKHHLNRLKSMRSQVNMIEVEEVDDAADEY